MVLRSLFAE